MSVLMDQDVKGTKHRGGIFEKMPCSICGATFEASDVVYLPKDGSPPCHYGECPTPSEPKAGGDSVNFSVDILHSVDPKSLIWHDKPPEPEISLLIIDLGDSCVVKVEKGELDKKFAGYLIGDPDARFADTEPIRAGERPLLASCEFDKIRVAIDALEDRPVPRLERHNKDGGTDRYYEQYTLIESDGVPVRHDLDTRTLMLLSKIAGHDLPIWEPKAGTWIELKQIPEPFELPFKVYRYTR